VGNSATGTFSQEILPPHGSEPALARLGIPGARHEAVLSHVAAPQAGIC